MKRIFDLTCALMMLILFSPLMVVLAIMIRQKMGEPIFFRQLRPGKDNKIFNIYKFRTMADLYDEQGNLLPDEVRLTEFGRFLRRSSLDELPQLFNVISGDMSLVGPRPLRVEYLPFYSAEQARRHEVKPGITGWAQVNGRNSLSWEERFLLDVWYVDHQSFRLDLQILMLTVLKVIHRQGVDMDTTREDSAAFRG